MSTLHEKSAPTSASPSHEVDTSPALDASEWNDFVRSCPGGDVVQTSNWAALKRAVDMEAHHVVVRDAGRLVAGAQVLTRTLRLIGRVGYVAHGPLTLDSDPAVAARVVDGLHALVREARIRYLIAQPPPDAFAVEAALAASGFQPGLVPIGPLATLQVDLSVGPDELMARMSSSARRNVRRTMRAGATFRIGTRTDLDRFHELHQHSAQRQKFEPMSLSYLTSMWDSLHPAGALEVALVELGEEALAGAVLLCHRSTVTFKVAAWSGDTRLPSNELLQYEAMRWAHAQGYRRYDLGGLDRAVAERMSSGTPRTELANSSQAFKLRFGGDVVLLPEPLEYVSTPVMRHVHSLVLSRLIAHSWSTRALRRLRWN